MNSFSIGQTVTVEVRLQLDKLPLKTVGFRLRYDPAALQVGDIRKQGVFAHENAALVNGLQGNLMLGYTNADNGVAVGGYLLLEVDFTTLKAGTHDLTLVPDTVQGETGKEADVTWNDDTVTVTAPADEVPVAVITLTVKG